jgi:hypothetical protein
MDYYEVKFVSCSDQEAGAHLARPICIVTACRRGARRARRAKRAGHVGLFSQTQQRGVGREEET